MTWEVVPEQAGSPRRFPWWIPMIVGIIVMLAALGLLLWPFVAASWVLVVLFGSALIANGLALLVRRRGTGASTAAGVVLIAVGVLSMVFSDFTVNALVVFVGVSVLLIGALWLALGVRAGGAGGAVPGVLIMLAGIVALIWPEVTLVFVAVIGGFIMLLFGGFMVWTSLALRRALNQR